MKILFITICIWMLATPLMHAQISDSNSEAINQYFLLNSKEKLFTESKSPKIDPNPISYVNLTQSGTENNIQINSLQTGDEQVVSQNGKQNNYEYYNYYSQENSTMQVNQEGTLNSLQVFGENSLMKDATINQKSDFKSIVIKNYAN